MRPTQQSPRADERTVWKQAPARRAQPARRQEVAVTKVLVHGPNIRRAAPAAASHGALRTIGAALGALRRWWAAERHYRPERRYMRGGEPHAARVLARR